MCRCQGTERQKWPLNVPADMQVRKLVSLTPPGGCLCDGDTTDCTLSPGTEGKYEETGEKKKLQKGTEHRLELQCPRANTLPFAFTLFLQFVKNMCVHTNMQMCVHKYTLPSKSNSEPSAFSPSLVGAPLFPPEMVQAAGVQIKKLLKWCNMK